MILINAAVLDEKSKKSPPLQKALASWETIVRAAHWKNHLEMRAVFPHADPVKTKDGRVIVVFNIKGNHYRLLAFVDYAQSTVCIHDLLTHAEYDRHSF